MKVGDLVRLSDPTSQYETWRNRVGVIRDIYVGDGGYGYADWQPAGERFALRVSAHRLGRVGNRTAAEASG